MVVLGDRNSRSKDVYDVQVFLPQADPAALSEALKATFRFRGDQQPKTISSVLSLIDTSVLRRGWKAAVASVKQSPNFDDAFAVIVSNLRMLGL